MRLALVMSLAAAPVLADGCPEAPDISAEIDPLYEELLQAPDEMTARGITNRMWLLWDNAPDEPSQEMLDEGMRARASFDMVRALKRFDALVSYCPFYAEGYNQRAFVNFIRQDYAAALPDLDRALELNPRHVGALSGRALTLIALGRDDEGQAALRAALEINPWLVERRLLKEEPGEEL
ncbi:MAG: tetratricopeptide repeat protein [Sagittula sp.]|uniref:tetratricopeptide repeat protein n=1 Tax=unclassified Sagittula TaxID=2624628 RepID=UPI0020C7E4DE|nr:MULTISPECIES: tetratricopeptide repeat protein [unclassified Sagittula]WHZ35686.1 tetratricopeptide repeat protein [Sagittula sp. MA-2]